MSLNERALRRMEALASAYAEGDTPWGPDRDLVSRETAVDAVMDVFATLDALRQRVASCAPVSASFRRLQRCNEWHP